MELNGKLAVVTGGTRGVGAGIAHAFAEAGADVVICARRPPDAPLKGAEFLPLDVRDPDAVQALFDGLPRVDVLVNNAGGTPYRPLTGTGTGTGAGGGTGSDPATDARRHARVIDLNLTAPLTVSLAAHAHLRRSRGSIVMIGSVSGSRPSPGSAAYGAAKAGLEHLARSMAVEWAPDIRVNTLVLGMVRTELSHLHYGDDHGVAAVARTVPLGRLAAPSDVGGAAVFLASDAAAYITGASLLVHGGGERPAFLAAATPGRDGGGDAVRCAGGGAGRATGGDADRGVGGRATGGDTGRPTGGDADRGAGGDTRRAAGGEADRRARGGIGGAAGGDADRDAGGGTRRGAGGGTGQGVGGGTGQGVGGGVGQGVGGGADADSVRYTTGVPHRGAPDDTGRDAVRDSRRAARPDDSDGTRGGG
ncbi:3-oxoacyl-[acyl-carrier-protein] reductase FabG [Streptomyces sp. MA5143a]|nr:3-oxoacyl-[acyl-carrier-protein] reductase FabG [Streptomyces sp. MA5143a]